MMGARARLDRALSRLQLGEPDVSESHDSEPITEVVPPDAACPPAVTESDPTGVTGPGRVAQPFDLDAIEKRAERATAGPWEANFLNSWGVRTPDRYSIVTVDQGEPVATIDDEPGDHGADAWFIANAREDVPALVSVIRAALALHPKITVPNLGTYRNPRVSPSRDLCGLCRDPWPCSTVKALS